MYEFVFLPMMRMRIYAAYHKNAEIYVTKSTQKIPTNTINLKINKNRKCFKRVHKIQSNKCGHLFSLGQLCDTLIHQGSIEVWTRSRSPCHFVPYQSGHVYFMIILYFFYQNWVCFFFSFFLLEQSCRRCGSFSFGRKIMQFA